MLELLNYKSKRLLNIMELLILDSGSTTFKKIEKKNNCSNKTVYDDLHYLKNEFKNPLRLQFSQNNIKAYGFTMYEYEKLKNKLMNESLHFQILIELSFNGPLTVSDLSWKFNYSESRIRHVIDELNKQLELYDIKLISNNGIFYFQTNNIETLIILLEKILSFELMNSIVKSFKNKCDRSCFKSNRLLKKINLPLLLNKQMKNYYYIYFNVSKESIISINDPHKFLKSEEEELQEISQIKELVRKIPFDMNEDEIHQTVGILNYYKYLLRICNRRIIREYNRYDYFYYKFSSENKQIITVFENSLKLVEKLLGRKFILYKEEILFHIYTAVRTLRVYDQKVIGIYSDLCCCHASSIAQSIKKHFPMHDFVILNNDKDADVDLIITTKLLSKDTPVNQVFISDFITIDDIYHIYSAIYLNENKTAEKIT